MMHVLAYDLGTSGTKAVLYDEAGHVVASAYEPCRTCYPQNGLHEQRPEDWWSAIVASTRSLLAASSVTGSSIAGLALSGHSLGAVPLDAHGCLLADTVPIWSDSRARSQAQRFFSRTGEEDWYMTTGNGFPAHLYAVFKMMWFRDHRPELFARATKFLGTKDYINYRLTGVMATDHSYASGSGVYDLSGRRYSDSLIACSDLPASLFPEICESSDVVGRLSTAAATELGLPSGIRVVCGGVDNACMAQGAGCMTEGSSYTSLGSSSWIAVASHRPVLQARTRPYVFAHCIPGMFVSATCIFASGSALKWARDQLASHLSAEAAARECDVYDLMTSLAAQSPAGSNKLIFNPSLAGGSSLEDSPNIRGAWVGLDLSHTLGDMFRALLEGVALNLRIALDALRVCTEISPPMLIVGGGSSSCVWRQIFADVYHMAVVKTAVGQDAGALGAASLAFRGCGIWADYSPIRQCHKILGTAWPDGHNSLVYEQMLPVYRRVASLLAEAGDLMADMQLHDPVSL